MTGGGVGELLSVHKFADLFSPADPSVFRIHQLIYRGVLSRDHDFVEVGFTRPLDDEGMIDSNAGKCIQVRNT